MSTQKHQAPPLRGGPATRRKAERQTNHGCPSPHPKHHTKMPPGSGTVATTGMTRAWRGEFWQAKLQSASWFGSFRRSFLRIIEVVGASMIKFDLGGIERFDVRAKQTSGIRVPLGIEILGDKMRSNFVLCACLRVNPWRAWRHQSQLFKLIIANHSDSPQPIHFAATSAGSPTTHPCQGLGHRWQRISRDASSPAHFSPLILGVQQIKACISRACGWQGDRH